VGLRGGRSGGLGAGWGVRGEGGVGGKWAGVGAGRSAAFGRQQPTLVPKQRLRLSEGALSAMDVAAPSNSQIYRPYTRSTHHQFNPDPLQNRTNSLPLSPSQTQGRLFRERGVQRFGGGVCQVAE